MARRKSHDPVPDTYFCGGAALLDGYPMNWASKPARCVDWPYMLVEAGAEAPAGVDPATGVDIIAHGLWNTKETPATPGELTPAMKAILDRDIANKVGWQPTIQHA
jgi:hypothetical protein